MNLKSLFYIGLQSSKDLLVLKPLEFIISVQVFPRVIAREQSLGMTRQSNSFVTNLGALLHLRALKQHLYVVFLSCITHKTYSIRKTVAL